MSVPNFYDTPELDENGYPIETPAAASPAPPDNDKPEKRSAAALLVDLAMDRYDFGCTTEGEAFAVPRDGDRHIVRMLRGGRSSLRAELAKVYRREHGRIAGQQALADAMLVLEGEAQDTEPQHLHLRVARTETAVWIDTGDAAGNVVMIAAAGWNVTSQNVPVLFRRTSLTGALPIPESGGDIGELWDRLNVAAADRPLVLAWLVAALGWPDIPHPVLALMGEQGTGKSTASRALVELVDPSPVPLRKPPKDADGWVTAASSSWAVGLDNMSAISDWLSDTLCRAVTGDGDVRRQLYTDAGVVAFSFRRVILLNGIDVGAVNSDLADRTILVTLDRIDESARRTESDLNRGWDNLRARLFGVLCAEVAGVAGVLSDLRLATAPRMADFARILAALDQRHGTDGLRRYSEQATTMAEDVIAGSPFLAELATITTEIFGTAAEIRAAVTPDEDGWRAPRDWPKNARAVTSILKRNAPALRRAGWSVDDLGRAGRDNVTRWRLTPPEIAGKTCPQRPQRPHITGNAGDAGDAGDVSRQSQDDMPPGALRSDSPGQTDRVAAAVAKAAGSASIIPLDQRAALGRCHECAWHMETMGHAPDCPNRQTGTDR